MTHAIRRARKRVIRVRLASENETFDGSGKIYMPADQEEAEIQRGTGLDPGSPEFGDDFFANAHLAREMMPPAPDGELTAPRQRGAGIQSPRTLVTPAPTKPCAS